MKNMSLTRRVVLLSSAWTILAVAILAWLLLSQFRVGAERNFAELQKAQLYSLIGSISLTGNGKFSGTPNLGDTNFLVPSSGWFWRVSTLTTDAQIASPSFSSTAITRPSLDQVPYDAQFSRSYTIQDSNGQKSRIYESEIDLGQNIIALFQVGGNQSEFDSDIRRFAWRTGGFLAAFGFGVVLINAMIILFGLRPLDYIRTSLADIRAGRSHTLEGDFPSEIAPMVDEMNVLIDNNRQIVERARTQVGNLAHSLKTPIAVLVNEAAVGKTVNAKIVENQTQAMQTQVQHYLSRARIAAQAGSVAFRTDAAASTKRLVSVMQKLNSSKNITLEVEANCPVFAGEKEDFEEILGNLLENACKWGKTDIRVSLSSSSSNPAKKALLQLTVEDDGPGIEESGYKAALKRGQRLDETVPGTGLGLSIVADTVSAYGGEITLSRSTLGGLKVDALLPVGV